MKSEKELAAQAAEGQREAFAYLYDRHIADVYDYARRIVHNPEVGVEVTRVAFERVMMELVRRGPPDRFKPWLYSIVHRTAMDYWRTTRKTVEALEDEPHDDSDDNQTSYLTVDTGRLSNPALVAHDNEIVEMVWQVAASLDRKEYALLDLHLRKGMGPEDIGLALGMRKSAVDAALSRALEALEGSVTALLLMRRGRADCAELDALVLQAPYQVMTKALARDIQCHARDCQVA